MEEKPITFWQGATERITALSCRVEKFFVPLAWSLLFFTVLGIGFLSLEPSFYAGNSARVLRGIGKGLGSLALWAVLASPLFYACRKILLWRKKAGLTAGIYAWLQNVLRRLHPALGLTALFLALWHGYLLTVMGRTKVVALVTGAIACAVLAGLGLTGMILRRRPGWRPGRRVHRSLLFVLGFTLLVHLILQ